MIHDCRADNRQLGETRDVLRHAMPNMRRCDITCVTVPGVGMKQERGRAVARCYGYRSRVAKSGKMGGYGSRAIAGLSSDRSNKDLMDMQQSDSEDEDGGEDGGILPAVEKLSGPTIEPDREASPNNHPKRKQHKLDIPVLQARVEAQEKRLKILTSALTDIEKLIRSRKTEFQACERGLQSYRAQAIESYLQLVVRKEIKGIPASETAAEALGFAKGWGS
jgi:hypothetical protein